MKCIQFFLPVHAIISLKLPKRFSLKIFMRSLIIRPRDTVLAHSLMSWRSQFRQRETSILFGSLKSWSKCLWIKPSILTSETSFVLIYEQISLLYHWCMKELDSYYLKLGLSTHQILRICGNVIMKKKKRPWRLSLSQKNNNYWPI